MIEAEFPTKKKKRQNKNKKGGLTNKIMHRSIHVNFLCFRGKKIIYVRMIGIYVINCIEISIDY